jgi:hypothetical protein
MVPTLSEMNLSIPHPQNGTCHNFVLHSVAVEIVEVAGHYFWKFDPVPILDWAQQGPNAECLGLDFTEPDTPSCY